MPQFGKGSLQKLSECHPKLQQILNKAIQVYDFTILEGARTLERQKELVASGASKTLDSKHLVQKDNYAHAFDIAPFPIDWNDSNRFFFLAGIIFMAAMELKIKIRWGHDWDGDKDFKDQTFNDSPHFELDPSEI